MTSDLGTRLRRHIEQIDAMAPSLDEMLAAIDIDTSVVESAAPANRFLDPSFTLRRHRVLVAVAAMVVAALAIAAPLLLMRGDEAGAPADQPPPPTAPPTTPQEPQPTLSAPAPEVEGPQPSAATTTEAPSASFDYGSVGTEAGQANTPLGPTEWWRLSRVPVDWVMAGFPKPGSSYSIDLVRVYDDPDRPCCFEVYAVPGGYLGFGAGADTRETAWSYSGDSEFRQWWPQLYSWVFVTEVWFSADGKTWELMARDPFGPGAAVMQDPFAVTVHDGRWVVIGWVDVRDERPYDVVFPHREPVPAPSVPAVWISEDLRTWTRIDVDFTAEGTHTMLTSIASGDQGWVIGGVRKTVESPIRAEWAMWGSRDGLSWEQLDVGDILGAPGCKPEPKYFCNRLKVEMTDDAIVAYGWEWNLPVLGLLNTGNRWTLWVGVTPIG